MPVVLTGSVHRLLQHVHAFTYKRCLLSWQIVFVDCCNMYMLSPVRDAHRLDRWCWQTAATCTCFHLPETPGVLTDGVNCQTAWTGRTGSFNGNMILIVSTSFLRSVVLIILRCAKVAAWSYRLCFVVGGPGFKISARTPVIMTVTFLTPC